MILKIIEKLLQKLKDEKLKMEWPVEVLVREAIYEAYLAGQDSRKQRK